MIQFRKSKKFGPLRLTLGKRGLSPSVGGGPLRLSFGADGQVRRTIRAPGLGPYDTKTIGGGQSPQQAQQGRKGNPLLALFGIAVGFGILWTACGGSDQSTNGTTGPQKVSAAITAAPWTAAPVDGT
jgi:hypothetical protein